MSPEPLNRSADGHAGELRCAALLAVALGASSSAANLKEESLKIDLKLTFADPLTSTPRPFFCQVKSGKSFRAPSSTKSRIKLQNIDEDTLKVFQKNLGIIAWVPPKPSSEVYWNICRPGIARSKFTIDAQTERISPSLRYIIAREAAQRDPAAAVAQQTLSKAGTAKEILLTAKNQYRKIRQIENALFGRIHLTRAAWRHITRRSKLARLRNLSLRATSALNNILSARPDSHSVKDSAIRREGSRVIEKRIIVCWYANALMVDGKRCAFMARVREEISYPRSWHKFPLSEGEINQRATLLSWWVREEKE